MTLTLPRHLSPADIAAALREYNRWRKGEGEYATAGAEPPLSPFDLTRVINAAEAYLMADAKNAKNAKKKGAKK